MCVNRVIFRKNKFSNKIFAINKTDFRKEKMKQKIRRKISGSTYNYEFKAWLSLIASWLVGSYCNDLAICSFALAGSDCCSENAT